jgi:hypothetical protein
MGRETWRPTMERPVGSGSWGAAVISVAEHGTLAQRCGRVRPFGGQEVPGDPIHGCEEGEENDQG